MLKYCAEEVNTSLTSIVNSLKHLKKVNLLKSKFNEKLSSYISTPSIFENSRKGCYTILDDFSGNGTIFHKLI